MTDQKNIQQNFTTLLFLCTRLPNSIQYGISSRLKQELMVNIINVDSLSNLFLILADHTTSINYIFIDIEEFHNFNGIEYFDVINSIKTMTSCIKTATKPIIFGIAGEATDSMLLKEEIKNLNGKIIVRHGNTITYEDVYRDINLILKNEFSTNQKLLAWCKPKKESIIKNEDIRLTPRQEQILKIINSRGCSNKIIAKMLGISESTVKLHISSIFKKYGVKNRTQLAVFSNKMTNS